MSLTVLVLLATIIILMDVVDLTDQRKGGVA